MAFRDKSASSILPYTCVYIGMWIVQIRAEIY